MGYVSMAFQSTLSCSAVCSGIGLHTGQRAHIILKPAPVNSGITFIRTDLKDKNVISANGLNVTTTQLGTTITNEHGAEVSTIEHLMAACAGIGLDNLIVEINGPEVPIMDGSSALYCRLMLQAGLTEQAAPRRFIRVLRPVEVRDGNKIARLSPAETAGDPLMLKVRIDFESAAIGVQTASLWLTPDAFVEKIAFARTFGFAKDVEKLQTMGLARGGSMDNAIVLDGDKVLNPEGLRVRDEFVRHKILDAIGDLFLAGGFIEGVFEGDQPGHAMNNRLLRALLDDSSAWEWATAEAEELMSVAQPPQPAPVMAALA